MKLEIIHETRYDYAPAAETAQHIAYLKPLDGAHQKLLSHAFEVSPVPTQIQQTRDVFGNSRCFFSLQSPHSQLKVVAHSLAHTEAAVSPKSAIPWERTREVFRYQPGAPQDAATEFVYASPFCPLHMEFAAYAQRSFGPGVGTLEGSMDLMHRIYTDFAYESQSTEINTPALQAFRQRRGVCQDFAHIMISCLRSIGLAARYVSGYLLNLPAPGTIKLQGSDASHAWVCVYLPDVPDGQRWFDLDPTNNRSGWHTPGEDYVRLAVGRDFADVSPLRGVIRGGTSHTLAVAVTVRQVVDGES